MPLTSPRATARGFDVPPIDHPNPQEHLRSLAEASHLLFEGKINSISTVTLTASSATSTLTDTRIGPDSFIGFMPTTANAKTEGTPYVTARGKQTATLNHANNSQSDRTYIYAILG